MIGYELLKKHKKTCLIEGNKFSTKCAIYDLDGNYQGERALLPPDNPNYCEKDKLMCRPNFIGLEINTSTGLGVMGDSAEIILDVEDIKLGVPERGWQMRVYLPATSKIENFKVETVAIDRVLGMYLIKPSIVTYEGDGKVADRQKEVKINKAQFCRKNGAI